MNYRYNALLMILLIFLLLLREESSNTTADASFRDLWHLRRLGGLRGGDFAYFYDLSAALKAEVANIYKFLEILYLNKNTKIFSACKTESNELLKLVCFWRYFIYCLTETNTVTDMTPCNPFYLEICYLYIPESPTTIMMPTTTTEQYSSNNTTSTIPPITTTAYFNYTSQVNRAIVLTKADFHWQFSKLKYFDSEIPIAIFNLFFCTLPNMKYICPDLCLSKRNLCANTSNLHSINCFSKATYEKEIEKLKEIQFHRFDPRSMVYSCDCAYGFTWSFTAKACSFGGFYPNPCNPITQAPCEEKGTAACIGDIYNGEFICRCKPQYIGSFCENVIDACQMDVVTLDGDTEREVDINSEKGMTSKSYSSGFHMCQVNMTGLAIPGKVNECIPELGTRKYYCICQYPFIEDLNYKVSNCLKRETSCYDQLCINGICKETADGGDSICICHEEYEGPMCYQKVTSWSHWSQCSPECGLSRSRIRSRESVYGLNYTQEELCPDRVKDDCPDRNLNDYLLSVPFTNDELKFYSFYLLTTLIGLSALSLIMYLSRLIRTPKFVGARQRIKEKNKSKKSVQKQRFSVWKVEQAQKDISQMKIE